MNPVSEVQVTYKPQRQKVLEFFIKHPIAMTNYDILGLRQRKTIHPLFFKSINKNLEMVLLNLFFVLQNLALQQNNIKKEKVKTKVS